MLQKKKKASTHHHASILSKNKLILLLMIWCGRPYCKELKWAMNWPVLNTGWCVGEEYLTPGVCWLGFGQSLTCVFVSQGDECAGDVPAPVKTHHFSLHVSIGCLWITDNQRYHGNKWCRTQSTHTHTSSWMRLVLNFGLTRSATQEQFSKLQTINRSKCCRSDGELRGAGRFTARANYIWETIRQSGRFEYWSWWQTSVQQQDFPLW